VALSGWVRGFDTTAAFETICAADLTVTLKRTRVRVAVDGEIIRVRAPVRYALRPDALRVIVPRA
jgi:diacylglycerol kinase family enzyme